MNDNIDFKSLFDCYHKLVYVSGLKTFRSELDVVQRFRPLQMFFKRCDGFVGFQTLLKIGFLGDLEKTSQIGTDWSLCIIQRSINSC